MLKTILSISGKPGLYKLISQGKNMLIVESLVDKKRFPAYGNEKIISALMKKKHGKKRKSYLLRPRHVCPYSFRTSWQEDTPPDITATNGLRYWMPMLFPYSRKQVSSIRTPLVRSVRISCQKEVPSTR